jgi:hypothetical protein
MRKVNDVANRQRLGLIELNRKLRKEQQEVFDRCLLEFGT